MTWPKAISSVSDGLVSLAVFGVVYVDRCVVCALGGWLSQPQSGAAPDVAVLCKKLSCWTPLRYAEYFPPWQGLHNSPRLLYCAAPLTHNCAFTDLVCRHALCCHCTMHFSRLVKLKIQLRK